MQDEARHDRHHVDHRRPWYPPAGLLPGRRRRWNERAHGPPPASRAFLGVAHWPPPSSIASSVWAVQKPAISSTRLRSASLRVAGIDAIDGAACLQRGRACSHNSACRTRCRAARCNSPRRIAGSAPRGALRRPERPARTATRRRSAPAGGSGRTARLCRPPKESGHVHRGGLQRPRASRTGRSRSAIFAAAMPTSTAPNQGNTGTIVVGARAAFRKPGPPPPGIVEEGRAQIMRRGDHRRRGDQRDHRRQAQEGEAEQRLPARSGAICRRR